MDTLQELKRQNGVVVRNILSNIQLPASDGIPVYPEAEIEKAVSEGTVQVFTAENLSQFKINLQKAEADANGDPDILAEIQKARRDISKLVKVKKQDKRGKMTTVYVRSGEKAKEGEAGKKSDASGEQKTITHHEGGSTKIVSNGLDVGAVSSHTGEVLKRYRADKPEEVEKYAKHLAIEHNIPVQDKKEEPKKHKDLGKVHPVDWDGPSKVKVVDADEKHVHVKRVGKDGKELEGDEHNMSYTHDEWKVEKQSGKALHNQDPKAFGDKPKKESETKRQDREFNESLARLDKQQKAKTEERKKRNDAVREWSGDEYTDSMIDSLEISYEDSTSEGNDLHREIAAYVNMIGDAGSQSRQAQQVWAAVEDIAGEFRPHSLHKDLNEQGLKDILWGMIMHKLNNR